MIIGIGVDIVANNRFSRWYENPNLVKRYFHPNEVLVLSKPREKAIQSLAVRFAAKEAFSKALGSGLRGLELCDICIQNDELGKPELLLYGSAQRALEQIGANKVFVSLSHEKEYGMAFVVLEYDKK